MKVNIGANITILQKLKILICVYNSAVQAKTNKNLTELFSTCKVQKPGQTRVVISARSQCTVEVYS